LIFDFDPQNSYLFLIASHKPPKGGQNIFKKWGKKMFSGYGLSRMLIFFILFLIGVLGIVLNRKNLLTLLMSIELLLLAINLIFIFSSLHNDSLFGQLFAFYVLVVAAAESAVGLSILVAYFRTKGSIAIQFINLLRG
jgi:hypothetical protein